MGHLTAATATMGRPTQPSTMPDDIEDSLTVIDNRTKQSFKIPIKDNAINATAFKQMKAETKEGERKENETEGGLRVLDPGYQNTAVISAESPTLMARTASSDTEATPLNSSL